MQLSDVSVCLLPDLQSRGQALGGQRHAAGARDDSRLRVQRHSQVGAVADRSDRPHPGDAVSGQRQCDGTEVGHHWAGCPSCWLPAGSNGRHITWPISSARFGPYSNGSDIPTRPPADGQSYFRDVVFCASLTEECGPLPPPPPPPILTTIVIAGSRFIERPSATTATTLRRGVFQTDMVDQYGKPIAAPLSWSVAGAPAGVSPPSISQPQAQRPTQLWYAISSASHGRLLEVAL